MEVAGIELPSKQRASVLQADARRVNSNSAYDQSGEVVRSGSVSRQKGAPVFFFQLKNKKGDNKKTVTLLRPSFALRSAACVSAALLVNSNT